MADITYYEKALHDLELAKARIVAEEFALKVAILADAGIALDSVIAYIASRHNLPHIPRATYTITATHLYKDAKGDYRVWLVMQSLDGVRQASAYHTEVEKVG